MPIVCGTDLTSRSDPAVAAARSMAERLEASGLWLVHVLDGAIGPSATVDTLAEAASSRLEAAAAEVRRRTEIPVFHTVLTSKADGRVDTSLEALASFAASRRARALVVSASGHETTADVPVVVVRDSSPFEAWAKGERPLRVLLAVDESASADPLIAWVDSLRKAGPCDVVIGRVYYAADAARRYGMPRAVPLLEPNPELEALLLRDLESQIGSLEGTGQVTYRLKAGLGRAGDHLLDLAEDERVDLIAVGTNRKAGIRRLTSVSNVVLRYSRCAAVSIPRQDAVAPAPRRIPRIERVLVATDLSAFSKAAVAHGYGLLAACGGEVHLVHVAGGGNSPGEHQEDAALIAQLQELVPPEAMSKGIVTRIEILRADDVPRALCEAAERHGVDATCVASHGRSGVLRLALGSVAEAFLRQSTRPVLVVRPPPR